MIALQSKGIKISDTAFITIRKELNNRLNSDNRRIKLKEVASDLIIAGFNNIQQREMDQQTVQSIITLKNWKNEYESQIVELIGNIVYWEHIKLALSKGYNPKSAKEHVHDFLTSPKNRQNILSIIDNYLNAFLH